MLQQVNKSVVHGIHRPGLVSQQGPTTPQNHWPVAPVGRFYIDRHWRFTPAPILCNAAATIWCHPLFAGTLRMG